MMHANLTFPIVALFVVSACSEDPAAPAELGPFYEATAADGQRLPIRSWDVVSNSAGSCEIEFSGGSLTFPPGGGYDMSLRFLRRCSGEEPVRTTERSYGALERTDDELSFTPKVAGTFSIRRGELDAGGVTLHLRRSSGREFTVRYARVPGVGSVTR